MTTIQTLPDSTMFIHFYFCDFVLAKEGMMSETKIKTAVAVTYLTIAECELTLMILNDESFSDLYSVVETLRKIRIQIETPLAPVHTGEN